MENQNDNEKREKRNLNVFGSYQVADRREYNYNGPNGYNYPANSGKTLNVFEK